jgi:integrase
MKIVVFVSKAMTTPIPFQFDSNVNGALSMACQKATPYIAAARAHGTRRVYESAWRRWEAWCRLMHTDALPAAPEAIAAYLAELADAGRSLATIKGALASILFFHRQAGHALERRQPAIAAVMGGIARRVSRPIRHAAPLELKELRRVLAGIEGDSLCEVRDRALLLVGFFGALRRSEIAALDVTGRSPIEFTDNGLILHLTGTKGSAATQAIAIPRRNDELCAVRAVQSYLELSSITCGPLFRAINKGGRLSSRRLDGASVRHILMERFGRSAGFTPHSLRVGFITSAAEAGAPEHAIQRTSRHKSVEVLRGYIRAGDNFSKGAASYL